MPGETSSGRNMGEQEATVREAVPWHGTAVSRAGGEFSGRAVRSHHQVALMHIPARPGQQVV